MWANRFSNMPETPGEFLRQFYHATHQYKNQKTLNSSKNDSTNTYGLQVNVLQSSENVKNITTTL